MTVGRTIQIALGALAVSLAGCDSLPPQPCPAVGMGMKAPALDSLRVGQSVQVEALPNLCLNPEAEVEWEVSNPDVARVAVTGRYTAELRVVAPGEGVLSVWVRGQPRAGGYRVGYRAPTPRLPELARDTEALSQTDSLIYSLKPSDGIWMGTVGVDFTNSRADTVSFQNCGGLAQFSLQAQLAGEWRTVWNPTLPPCISPPIVVPPGATHRFTIGLGVDFPWSNGSPRSEVKELPGVYRLVWGAIDPGAGEAPGASLPLEQRVSNRFLLSAVAG